MGLGVLGQDSSLVALVSIGSISTNSDIGEFGYVDNNGTGFGVSFSLVEIVRVAKCNGRGQGRG